MKRNPRFSPFTLHPSLFTLLEQSHLLQAVGHVLESQPSAVHFAIEERHMLQYGYSGYGEHKAEHEGFTRDFMDLKAQYEIYGATSALVMEAERRTAFWLRNHIGRVDKALGVFLKENLVQRL